MPDIDNMHTNMYNKSVDYTFEWDAQREAENLKRHKVDFLEAVEVFCDENVIHLEDEKHSSEEDRCYAVGKVKSGKVITVRYTVRGRTIRIYGAANWRKWRRFYEKENSKSE